MTVASFACISINLKCDSYSPEEKIRQLEKKVNELIEESCFANSRGEMSLVKCLHFMPTMYLHAVFHCEIHDFQVKN